MSNILTVQEFKEIFYEWNTNYFKYKDFEKLYEELKELNAIQLKDLIRAFNGAMSVYKTHIANDTKLFNDKFKAETKDLIQAHKINIIFVEFSPLLKSLFFRYMYIHYFRKENKKLQELKNEIDTLFKEKHPKDESSYKYTDRRITKYERLIDMKKWRNLSDLRLNENKLKSIKLAIERRYKKKHHQDDHYKWLIYELVKQNILNEKKANKIIKSFLDYKGNHIIYDDNLKQQIECKTFPFIIGRNY